MSKSVHEWYCFCPICIEARLLRAVANGDIDDLDARIALKQERDRDANADGKPDESDGGALLNGE